MPDLGIGEFFTALLAEIGTDAAVGAGAAGVGEAAGLTAGEAAFLGSAGAAAAAPLSAADLALTGAIAGGIPATTGALAAAGFGDALGGTAGALGAGGLTAGESGFLSAAGNAAAAPLSGADLALTSAIGSGIPATTDALAASGVDLGAFSGGAGAAAPLSSSATPLSASSPQSLGGVASSAPGPGAIGAAPPSAVNPAGLDLTSTAAQGGAAAGPGLGTPLAPADASSFGAFQAGTVPQGTAEIGADVAGSGAAAPGASGVGAETGATFADSLTPATTGTAAGPVESGAFTTPESGGFFHSIGGALDDAGKFLSSPTGKVLGAGVSGAGLLKSLLTQPNIPGEAQLSQLASQLGATGQSLIGPNAAAATTSAQHATSQAATLENYLNTGSLPPAVQSSLDQATNSAITNIKAQYASRGMPPGSSAEQQDIAAIRQRAIGQGGTLAAQLYSQGVGLDQLAANIYQGLAGQGAALANAGVGALGGVVNTNVAQNNGVNAAIANLSSALGGGRTIVNGQTVAAA